MVVLSLSFSLSQKSYAMRKEMDRTGNATGSVTDGPGTDGLG